MTTVTRTSTTSARAATTTATTTSPDPSSTPATTLDARDDSARSATTLGEPRMPDSAGAFDYASLVATDNAAHEKPASVDDVLSGKRTLSLGSTGDAVKAIQQVLHLQQNGTLGPTTAKAIEAFKNAHDIHTPAGVDASTVGKTTMDALMRNHISPNAKKQMDNLLSIAQQNASSDDSAPWGHCYGSVWSYLEKANASGGIGNGKLTSSDVPSSFAAQFGEWMNTGTNAASVGMKRLDITNPYDAPPGAIVVVAAGSPGTSSHDSHGDDYATNNGVSLSDWRSHKDWPGDISIATGDGTNFVNDHTDESYGSRADWEKARAAGTATLIGAYVPL